MRGEDNIKFINYEVCIVPSTPSSPEVFRTFRFISLNSHLFHGCYVSSPSKPLFYLLLIIIFGGALKISMLISQRKVKPPSTF